MAAGLSKRQRMSQNTNVSVWRSRQTSAHGGADACTRAGQVAASDDRTDIHCARKLIRASLLCLNYLAPSVRTLFECQTDTDENDLRSVASLRRLCPCVYHPSISLPLRLRLTSVVSNMPNCAPDALVDSLHAHVLIKLLPGLFSHRHHPALVTCNVGREKKTRWTHVRQEDGRT
jgi:hypothetical protein